MNVYIYKIAVLIKQEKCESNPEFYSSPPRVQHVGAVTTHLDVCSGSLRGVGEVISGWTLEPRSIRGRARTVYLEVPVGSRIGPEGGFG